jgi:hypothetical protein|tara:strand:- start:1239 stop:1688 length:450 start_codon:yes stop_codon:yes gene_type:complete
MRYVTMGSLDTFDRLTLSINALCEANADTMADADTDETLDLPFCESDAWGGAQEDVLLPLGFVSIYYQKVHNPNADDFRARQLMPIEVYESKAGAVLMRAYDLNAGFVKSFRLDAVQRVLIRNQNLSDDEWGVQDITFKGRSALNGSTS